MLRFFRSSSNTVVVVIVVIGILTWLHVFSGREILIIDKYGTILFQVISGLLDYIPRLYKWFGMILFLFAAIIMIFVNAKLHLIDRVPYLPALCYMLLIGGVPEAHLFNPAIIATLLLIAAFVILVGSFENERLSYSYFIVPAIISFATFFYQYMYVYMLAVWLVIALWRPGYWREWVFSILGFLFPLFLAFSWFFLVEDDLSQMGVFFNEIFNIKRIDYSYSVSLKLFFIVIIAMIAFIFVFALRYISSKKTAIRTGYYLLMIITLITLIKVFIVPDTMPQVWYILSFPLSFFISTYFANVKSKRMGNIVLAVFFVGVIVAQVLYKL